MSVWEEGSAEERDETSHLIVLDRRIPVVVFKGNCELYLPIVFIFRC